MGYRPPPPPPPRLNLDRFGMPRDYVTYMWVTYGERVSDGSPERRAFEQRPEKLGTYTLFSDEALEDFGEQVAYR